MSNTTMNERAAELLTAVEAGHDQWQTRRMLAQRLGKRYLNPVEVLILDRLAEQGAIEIDRRQRCGKGVTSYTTYYRAKAVERPEWSNDQPDITPTVNLLASLPNANDLEAKQNPDNGRENGHD